MAQQIGRLNARRLSALTAPGRHADGGNLYLAISPNGGRRWVFLYRRDGKQHEIGLGSARSVSLAKARTLAKAAHDELASGGDPRSVRQHAGGVTFGEAADALVASLTPSWRNEKHAAQWRMTLEKHAASLRSKPVASITTEDVLAVLKPLWQSRPETAGRLRGRIERVLDAAKARGWRDGENPARWRGHLAAALPVRPPLSRGHHAAMPFAEVPAFANVLRARSDVSARALEFCILTAARTGEVIGARWDEIDIDVKIWTVPAARMKAGREHKVPLPDRAIAILEMMKAIRVGAYVFPSVGRNAPLSQMALTMAFRRAHDGKFTVHGFRSSFRDWAGDATMFPRELAEAALAHSIKDATEAAYRRSNAMEKRRTLMDAWSNFLAADSTTKVVPIRPQRV